MRIGLLTPELPPFRYGGIGQYVLDLAKCFADRQCDVTVFGPDIHPEHQIQHKWGKSISFPVSGQSGLGWTALQKAVNATHRLTRWFPAAKSVHNGLASYLLGMRHAAAVHRLARLTTTLCEGCDIVEVPNWQGWGSFLKPAEYRLICRLSSPAIDCGDLRRRVTMLETETCHNASIVISNSQAMRAKAHALYGLPTQRITVVPHGVADVAIARRHRSNETCCLLYVGRSEPRKGTDILIRAMCKAMPRNPDLSVTFIGPTDDDVVQPFPELATKWQALRKQVGTRIRCLGRVDEAEKCKLYSESHWLLIPSRFESFGLVAIEALRAGTPFVASNAGGLPEIAANTAASIVVDSNNEEAWEDALSMICAKGTAYAESLRQQAREAFEQCYTSDKMAERSLAIYASLLEQPVDRLASRIINVH